MSCDMPMTIRALMETPRVSIRDIPQTSDSRIFAVHGLPGSPWFLYQGDLGWYLVIDAQFAKADEQALKIKE